MSAIICEPRQNCADPNVNRWYCHRKHDAPTGICPLRVCVSRGTNTPDPLPWLHAFGDRWATEEEAIEAGMLGAIYSPRTPDQAREEPSDD